MAVTSATTVSVSCSQRPARTAATALPSSSTPAPTVPTTGQVWPRSK